MSYSDLLKDPRWQRKRLEIMDRDNWACVACCSTTATLNVHHVRYVQGRMPWEYPADELETLCEGCHADKHGKGEKAAREREEQRRRDETIARRAKIREENPAEADALDRMDVIDALMPTATNEQKDALTREKILLRDMLAGMGRRHWKNAR